MLEIHEADKKFKIGIFTPGEWKAGISRPSVTVEMYPIFKDADVSFEAIPMSEVPEVVDGMDPLYVVGKLFEAIKAELDAEGEMSPESRMKEGDWILCGDRGYVTPGHEYRAIAWFVSERPGTISAIWLVNADSVPRDRASIDEPRGHRYRV